MKILGAKYAFVVEFRDHPDELVLGTGMTTGEAVLATDEAISRAGISSSECTHYHHDMEGLAKFLEEAGWLTPAVHTMSSDEVMIHGFQFKQ